MNTEKIVISKEVETFESPKIDLNLLRKRSNAKTFSGWLLGEMKKASNEENLNMAKLIEFIYKKYKTYETSEKIVLNSWKGKSGIKVFVNPDSFDVITHVKKDQDSKPVEVSRNIKKREVNEVIIIINKINNGQKIPTREIGEMFYHEKWNDIFSNRFEHTELNLILRILDYFGIIHYRGGFTLVLKNVREIQEVLNFIVVKNS